MEKGIFFSQPAGIAAGTEPDYEGRQGHTVRRALCVWIGAVILLVVAMVILGGATRLTDSGLSMVRWEPVHGILPPLNEAAWQEEFRQYQQYPEYQKRNRGMSLAEFKRIFWFEYGHRLLGRLIGLAMAVPLVGFFLLGWLRGKRLWQCLGLFFLGGLQGLVGWWMVQSGLIDRPDVSHLRLTVHLGLAFLIFAGLLWLLFDLRADSRGQAVQAQAYTQAQAQAQIQAQGLAQRRHPQGLAKGRYGFAWALLIMVYGQCLLGALVAGLDAGYVYNSFPKMGPHWLPPEVIEATSWWPDAIDSPVFVQFLHRLGAYAVLLLVVVNLWLARHDASRSRGRTQEQHMRPAWQWLVAAVALQFSLGVLALVLQVPLTLALLHQFGALLLLAASLYWLYDALYKKSAPSL